MMGAVKLILLLCVASVAIAKSIHHSEQLYNAIVSGAYTNAIELANTLYDSDKDTVQATIEKLSTDDIETAMQYAYKLWISGKKDVVVEHFPQEFKMIFNEDDVRVVSSKFNIPLKLDMNTDSDGDRFVWGDGSAVDEYRHRFRFEPILINDKVMFKIKNVQHGMYMKLDSRQDDAGDRMAYGDSLHSNMERLIFRLEPYKNQNGLQFYIISNQYKQALKLALSTDDYNDRKLYGHHGEYREDPLRFGWKIMRTSAVIPGDSPSNIQNQNADIKELYKSVTEGLYEKSLKLTDKMMQNNQEHVKTTVRLLLEDGVRNVMSYGYKLWDTDRTNVIIDCFPKTFKAIFSGKVTQIFNVQYRLPLKLDANTDSDGDRRVWGDATNAAMERLLWTFTPTWEHNRVFFKINYVQRNSYMKLDSKVDSDGDRAVWGNSMNVDDNRLIFALEPQVVDEQLTFYIINQEFGQALKLGVSTDSYKDRLVWGHKGVPYGNERRKWTIVPGK